MVVGGGGQGYILLCIRFYIYVAAGNVRILSPQEE